VDLEGGLVKKKLPDDLNLTFRVRLSFGEETFKQGGAGLSVHWGVRCDEMDEIFADPDFYTGAGQILPADNQAWDCLHQIRQYFAGGLLFLQLNKETAEFFETVFLVAPHLTVVIGTASNLGFGSLPWTPSWLLWLPPWMPERPLWLPPWRRNFVGEQFINRPTMICNATGHRRCSFKPLVATGQSRQPQALMLRAEVVDTTHKVHSRLQGLTLPGQRSRAPGQTVKTTAKGPVDALNKGGVDIAFALRLFDHLCDGLLRPLIDLPPHADDPIVLILLDHLRDQNVAPFDHPTSSRFISRLFLAEDFPDRLRITRQAINAEENRPAERRGASFDARDQTLDQFAVSMEADLRDIQDRTCI